MQKKRHLAKNILCFLPMVKTCSYLVYFYYIVSVLNKTECTDVLLSYSKLSISGMFYNSHKLFVIIRFHC